ncbi:MAG: ABC transporter permease [Spirochaetaceae bacterium 4572_59]|nr:MAG: ABC transporter permease [Spirochaetaceae bacterium 4572_59]
MKLGTMAFRNILRNKRRSILSGTAIMIAAMSIVMLFSFLAGMSEDIQDNLHTYKTGAVRIRHKDFTKYERLNPMHLTVGNTGELLKGILNEPGVTMVSPRISFPTRIYRDGENFNAFGTGVDFSTETEYQNLGPEVVQKGRIPEMGKNEVLIGYKLAEKVAVDLGDKITILSSTAARGTNAISFTITGLVAFPMESLNNMTILAPLDRVQYFLRMPDQVQEILLKVEEDVDTTALASLLREKYADNYGLEIMGWMEMETTYSWIEMAQAVYDIFALFFFVLGSSVILNTTIMVIFERMREIGTMTAMGMSGKDLVRLFFTEAFIISVIGSFAGVLLGIGLTQILGVVGINFGKAMEGVDFEISSVLYPKLNLKSTVVVFFYSVVVASLTAILPARKTSRIEVVDALRAV